MDPSDLERGKFVGHFAYFDAQSKMETEETNPNPIPTPNQSKMETEEIPVIDYAEVQQLLLTRSLSLP
eukprot:scaffold67022_cov36-Phaeocystis_antarctica.AAC.1